MPDPVLDPSTPCCRDFSRLQQKPRRCATGPTLAPGGTGGLTPPATGTWTNTLNATGGGSGGGTGASWIIAPPASGESWS